MKDQKLSIAFPDDGACKRFGKMFSAWEPIICAKIREGKTRTVKIKVRTCASFVYVVCFLQTVTQEGSPEGTHVIIVDDLVQTGGTLIQCKEALFARGWFPHLPLAPSDLLCLKALPT